MAISTSNVSSLYGVLNQILSENYSCLKLSSQDKILSGDLIKTRKDIFGKKTLKEQIQQDTLRDLALRRQNHIDKMLPMSQSFLDDGFLDAHMQVHQGRLINVFNWYYDSYKSFDECFNGFEILDPEFKKVIEAYERFEHTSKDEGLNTLIKLYYEYLSFYQDYTCTKAYKDLLVAMSDDVTSHGYPSTIFQKPLNPEVKLFSKEKIWVIFTQASTIQKEADEDYRAARKELDKMNRKSKHKYSPDMSEPYRKKRVEVLQLGLVKDRADKLLEYISQLSERMKSANKDIDPSSNPFFDAFVDLVSGVNIFEEQTPFEIDKVYVHQREIDFYTYLFHSYKKGKESVERTLNNPENSSLS